MAADWTRIVLGRHFLEHHGPLDVTAILVLAAAVNVPLLVSLPFLLRCSKLIANAILSLVVLVSGAAAAYIIHTGLYAAENQIDLVTIGVAAMFVLFISFRAIDQQRWEGVTLVAVVLIGLGTVLGGHFLEVTIPPRPPRRWKSTCLIFNIFHFARNPIYISYPSSH